MRLDLGLGLTSIAVLAGMAQAPAPAYGSLTWASSLINPTPTWVLYGDFKNGDVIQFERQVAGGDWSAATVVTHTVNNGELSGVSGSLGMAALADGSYQARFKYHRAGSTNWSIYNDNNTPVSFTIAVPNAAYTFQAALNNVGGSNTADYSVDIGSASSDKYLLIGVTIAGNTQTITSLTIDPAGTPLALAQLLFYNPSTTTAFYGVAAPGISGTKTIRLITTGASFVERNIYVYSLTGLNSQSVKNPGQIASASLAMTADPGDLLFALAAVNGGRTFSGSTEAPTHQVSVGNGTASGSAADWRIAGSYPANGFTIVPNFPAVMSAISFK